ncbi:MAG TPA: DUF3471 domain-containing protein [Blastocatellia bacterium]|nr:DUF3471 domain-containing protein [Blastocatellia bacterium]
MKSLKITVAFGFAIAIIAALASESLAFPPFVAKSRKFGAKDCTFCHVEPEGGPPWNDRGKWLIAEKERRGAEAVDVEWLAEYKAGVQDKKPVEVPKTEDKQAAPPAATQPGKPDPKTFDDYVGEYELPIFTLVITHEGDKLFGQPAGDSKEELIPESDGTFSVTNVSAKLKFVRDDKGKIIELQINLHGQEIKGKKTK